MDWIAFEEDFSGARSDQARNGPKHSRFAGAVGADQGEDLAFVHLQGDLPQDNHIPVSGAEALNLQQA